MRCLVVYDLVSEKVGIELTATRIVPFVVPLLNEPDLNSEQVLLSSCDYALAHLCFMGTVRVHD